MLQHRVDLGLSICIDWNEALSCRKLRTLRAEVLLPETHALAGRKSLRLADLCGERLLFEGCPAYYTFLQEFERAAREPQIVTAINDPQAVLSYVQAGMGICPVVYAPGRGAAQLPRGVRAVPYESGSEIALYAYWDGEEPGELEALFLQQLERSLP